jgi:hypothetical protein
MVPSLTVQDYRSPAGPAAILFELKKWKKTKMKNRENLPTLGQIISLQPHICGVRVALWEAPTPGLQLGGENQLVFAHTGAGAGAKVWKKLFSCF